MIDRQLADVMPKVSRAIKRGDHDRARQLLTRIVGREVAVEAVRIMVRDPRPAAAVDVLTPAQWGVWNAACGLTAGDAADRYHRTVGTVLSHRKAALKRLGVGTVAGAVAECYRRGIFDRKAPLEPVDW